MKKLISFLTVLLFLPGAYSSTIQVVKGNQVLIENEGGTFSVGQQLLAKDSDGKNRTLLRVKKVGKAKTLATIEKGKAEIGYTVASRRPASEGSVETEVSASTPSARKKMGVMLGYLMNTMSANYSLNSVNKSTSMKGSGFGLLGYYDLPVGKDFDVRGLGGLEQFQVSQSKDVLECDQGTSYNCNVNINYLSLYGILKYRFNKGQNVYWAGGGMGYLLAMSKSSTVLDTSLISTNQVFTISAGVDLRRAGGKVIPVSLDYSLFPASGTVNANMISLRVGWGWGR